MIYKIKKPNIKIIDQEKIINLFLEKSRENDSTLQNIINKTMVPRYLYWDELRYKKIDIQEINTEELWFLTKIFRKIQSRPTIISSENNKVFSWINIPGLDEFLHQIDMKLGGSIITIGKINDEKEKQRLISRGIIEESIASSQLEGAATTREVAKELIREGRKPKNKSEQMILNNYQSIIKINEEYKNEKLTLNLLLELHNIITDKTWEKEDYGGKLRTDDDNIIVTDKNKGEIYHIPPKAEFTKRELIKLIDFFNNELETDKFIHPLIKAILIHFWVGYLHPFCDGNGRMARMLFYWYLLKEGYWGMQFLPLSRIIKKSPNQYKMAYVYSEQDDNDLTYFIDYNINKIKIALAEFESYLNNTYQENSKISRLAKAKYNLNNRQILLLRYLVKDTDHKTNQTTHQNLYQISKATAIHDLKRLENLGFLTSQKDGKNKFYYATKKINDLF